MKLQILLYFLLSISKLVAQQSNNSMQYFNLDENKIAVEGYDLVSYFSQEPKEGKESYTFIYQGVSYYFINEFNRKSFISTPNKYLPQYGGWCAYALGDSGERVEVDPKTYKIVDGKLYLFYNKLFLNTLKYWNKREPKLMQNADETWKRIIKSTN